MNKVLVGIRLKIIRVIHEGISQFNKINAELSIRSNDLSYHLKLLRDNNMIVKLGTSYSLTKTCKNIYPYLPIFANEEIPVFVVTSVALIDGDTVYLQKKPREPDKDKLMLFGTKILPSLTIEESAKKTTEDQSGVTISNLKLKCINEYIKDGNHWVVYFFTANPDKKPNTISAKLSKIDSVDLFGENKFFLKNMLNGRGVKSTITKFD